MEVNNLAIIPARGGSKEGAKKKISRVYLESLLYSGL